LQHHTELAERLEKTLKDFARNAADSAPLVYPTLPDRAVEPDAPAGDIDNATL
jgi:hypothetical protein